MVTYRYGGKNAPPSELKVSEDRVVVRTRDGKPLAEAVETVEGKQILDQFMPVSQFPEAGVYVLQGQSVKDHKLELRDRARMVLSNEKNVRYAGRLLEDAETGEPVLYTENLFVKFWDEATPEMCEEVLKKYNLEVKRKLDYATNAYFVAAPEDSGLDVFRIAEEVLNEKSVEYCHPELIRRRHMRVIPPFQWHLALATIGNNQVDANANVEQAWAISRGQGITIAIIDDGVDIDHEELNGAGKVVNPFDMTLRIPDPRPKDPIPWLPENHGTACAGVAAGAGLFQCAGVAPDANLMPIRLASNLGSQDEADAFTYAADHGADVISCSWGPADGDWWDLNDPVHNQPAPLPDSTRLAIDYAVRQGRGGKGCVILWAAGNGNENVENDGYAGYEQVIAVAACNDIGKRSIYSDFGASIWCCFPSSDFGYAPFQHPDPLTPGIWTTDRSGNKGYNPGALNPGAPPPGDEHGNYTQSFGGTSSACPGAAGTAALILAANPDLAWHEVRDILRATANKIDAGGGSYDAGGHSPFYGYGRIDAAAAVQAAAQMRQPLVMPMSDRIHVNGDTSSAEIIRQLEIELEKVRTERDILKKALAILSEGGPS